MPARLRKINYQFSDISHIARARIILWWKYLLTKVYLAYKGQLRDIKTCGTILISSWSSEINYFRDFWRKTCLFMSLFIGSSLNVKRIYHSNQSRLLDWCPFEPKKTFWLWKKWNKFQFFFYEKYLKQQFKFLFYFSSIIDRNLIFILDGNHFFREFLIKM